MMIFAAVLSVLLAIVALAAGVGIGVAALIGGVRVGSAVYDSRSAELLAAALKN